MEREPHGITQQIQSFGFLAIVGTVSALYIWESQFWSWIAVGSVWLLGAASGAVSAIVSNDRILTTRTAGISGGVVGGLGLILAAIIRSPLVMGGLTALGTLVMIHKLAELVVRRVRKK